MANLKSLVKDTAVYGLSSIVGRFLNYLLVPLYTNYIPKETGEYGETTNIYAYTALIMVILTFGMETTLFRFANKKEETPDTVFSTSFTVVGALTALFVALLFIYITPISEALGYKEHPEFLLMMGIVVALDAIQALPFSYLRFQRRPMKFASLKALFIVLNIGLNVIFFVLLHRPEAFYIFFINLLCTAFITFFFIPDMFKIHWHFDSALLKRMLSYSWPILVLGIAGILNQTADKILYPLIDTTERGMQELGEYGACVKIAMIMALITQAFRYAYEPIVFAKQSDKESKEYYGSAMKYFIIFTLLAYLCVIAYIDILKIIVGPEYHGGLKVVPIVMAAEIMMGIYFNLSFWYKLIDRTIWGLWFSLAGCIVLILINILFIPSCGYMACAWGGVAGYGIAMLLSYIVGQKKNPIRYPIKSILIYTIIAALFTAAMLWLPKEWPFLIRLAINTTLVILFVAHIIYHDLPLSSLPIINKILRRK